MRALLFVVIIVMVAPLIAFASHVESHPWLWAAIVIWVAFAVAFLWEVFVGPIRPVSYTHLTLPTSDLV